MTYYIVTKGSKRSFSSLSFWKKLQISVDLLFQVSALALDPSGARLVTGGHDFIVKFWDFAGMDQSLQSFRQIKPCERHGSPIYFRLESKVLIIQTFTTSCDHWYNIDVILSDHWNLKYGCILVELDINIMHFFSSSAITWNNFSIVRPEKWYSLLLPIQEPKWWTEMVLKNWNVQREIHTLWIWLVPRYRMDPKNYHFAEMRKWRFYFKLMFCHNYASVLK